MKTDEACTSVLEAADELFYARGVHAVGMDALRTAARRAAAVLLDTGARL